MIDVWVKSRGLRWKSLFSLEWETCEAFTQKLTSEVGLEQKEDFI